MSSNVVAAKVSIKNRKIYDLWFKKIYTSHDHLAEKVDFSFFLFLEIIPLKSGEKSSNLSSNCSLPEHVGSLKCLRQTI